MPGLTEAMAEAVGTCLLSIPTVTLSDVVCGLEGDEGEVMEGDLVTCTVDVTLTRPSHSHSGAQHLLLWLQLLSQPDLAVVGAASPCKWVQAWSQ